MKRKQWNKLKREHNNMVLLFSVGEFYEAFHTDAVTIGNILNRKWSVRDDGKEHINMIGFPQSELEESFRQLLRRGHKVGVMDQVRSEK